jgi:ComF family protein
VAAWQGRLATLADFALDWLLPPECAACDAAVAHGPLCASCRALLRAPAGQRALEGVPVLAAAAYAPPIAPALRRLKYHARPDLARPLAALAVPTLLALGVRRSDVFVPVPLHPKRLAERGYNQAALLARAFATSTGARYAPRALARRRDTPQQAGLKRRERLLNVESVMQARGPSPSAGGRIVLVDDVVTTGATALGCIRALRDAGAEVCAVVAIGLADDAP